MSKTTENKTFKFSFGKNKEGENKPAENKPFQFSFGRNKEGENKPAENKPVENKPAENKTFQFSFGKNKEGENKPAENKPAENKPAENKTFQFSFGKNKEGENKPAENKPVENKPVENKPAENKPFQFSFGKNKEGENKPAENKPAENKTFQFSFGKNKEGENKPAENKPVENKPAENKTFQFSLGKNKEGEKKAEDKPAENKTFQFSLGKNKEGEEKSVGKPSEKEEISVTEPNRPNPFLLKKDKSEVKCSFNNSPFLSYLKNKDSKPKSKKSDQSKFEEIDESFNNVNGSKPIITFSLTDYKYNEVPIVINKNAYNNTIDSSDDDDEILIEPHVLQQKLNQTQIQIKNLKEFNTSIPANTIFDVYKDSIESQKKTISEIVQMRMSIQKDVNAIRNYDMVNSIHSLYNEIAEKFNMISSPEKASK